MTFDARERSADQGQPVELFTFLRGYLAWRYTSADRDVVVDGHTFATTIIKRGGLNDSGEVAKAGLKLTVPRDFAIADMFRVSPPTDTIALTVNKFHLGDNELASLWTGRVVGCSFGGSFAELDLDPTYTSLDRNGLRRAYQRQCPHVLYGPSCRANKDAFKAIGAVTTIAGLTVSAAAFAAQPDGYWAGGWIEWEIATGIFERRFVLEHTASTVTLANPATGLTVGAAFNAYPGCPHTMQVCLDRFNNLLNYGGMPYIPQKNPFGGNPIY